MSNIPLNFQNYQSAVNYLRDLSFKDYKAKVQSRPDLPQRILILFIEHIRENPPEKIQSMDVLKVIRFIEGTNRTQQVSILFQQFKIQLATINEEAFEGGSRLHLAVAFKDTETVLKLLDKDNIDLRDDASRTPLHWAAYYGKTELVLKLVEKRAKINAMDNESLTPLQLACRNKQYGAAFDLIEKGASFASYDMDVLSLVPIAASRGRDGVALELLERGEMFFEMDKKVLELIHLAASSGKLNALLRLIRKGADVNSKDNDGLTPLFRAFKSGHYGDYGVVFELIEKRADINAKDKNGQTLLHWAAARPGCGGTLVKLIQKGADFNAKDNDGLTPLLVACKNKNFDTAVLLIDKGATFTAEDKEVLGLIHSAASQGEAKAFFLLIENGADINAQDNEGMTPLQQACKNGRYALALDLVEKGATFTAEDAAALLHKAAFYGMTAALLKFIARGADVNAVDSMGQTPLQRACVNKQYPIAHILIEKGAVFNKREHLYLLSPQEQLALLKTLSVEEKEKLSRVHSLVAIAIRAYDEKDFTQTTDIKCLTPDQVKVVIPHFDLTFWQVYFRPFKQDPKKSQEILSSSLPSQIATLETQDLLVYDYFILEKKLDKIAKELKKTPANEALKKRFSDCDLSRVKKEQRTRDQWMSKTFDHPKLGEQRAVYEAKCTQCLETIHAISRKYEALKKSFEP